MQHLILASSAPGESLPPLPINTHAAASDVRHDVVKAGTIISEIHRDVVKTQAIVRDVLKGQQEAGSQDLLVSDICALIATG